MASADPSAQSPQGTRPAPGERDPGHRSERLRLHAQELQSSASGLGEATRGLVDELQVATREQLEQRPYTTLGATVAVGFVLGGGLSVGVLRRIAGLGGRIALTVALRNVFNGGLSGSTNGAFE